MQRKSLTEQYLQLQLLREDSETWLQDVKNVSHSIHIHASKLLTLEKCHEYIEDTLTGEMEKVKDAALTTLHSAIASGVVLEVDDLRKVDDAFNLVVNIAPCIEFTGDDIKAIVEIVRHSSNGCHNVPGVEQYINEKLRQARDGIDLLITYDGKHRSLKESISHVLNNNLSEITKRIEEINNPTIDIRDYPVELVGPGEVE